MNGHDATPLEHAAAAVAQRATWPSLHWGMRPYLHPEAARALTEAAVRAYLAAASDDAHNTSTDRETSR